MLHHMLWWKKFRYDPSVVRTDNDQALSKLPNNVCFETLYDAMIRDVAVTILEEAYATPWSPADPTGVRRSYAAWC